MSNIDAPKVGEIVWRDLTVDSADEIRDFYGIVSGWTFVRHPMEDGAGAYNDYCMKTADGKTMASGICHARGENAKLPPQWLIYINVENVEKSAKLCVDLGGKIIDGPRTMADKPFCVIQDPAGAYAALIQA